MAEVLFDDELGGDSPLTEQIEMVDVDGVPQTAYCFREHVGLFKGVRFFEHNQHGKVYWIEEHSGRKLGEYVAQGERTDEAVLISASESPCILTPDCWFWGSRSEAQLYAHPRTKTLVVGDTKYDVPRGITWVAKRRHWQVKCCGRYLGIFAEDKLTLAVRELRKEHLKRFGRSPMDFQEWYAPDKFLSASDTQYRGVVHAVKAQKDGGIKIIFKSENGQFATQKIQAKKILTPTFSDVINRAVQAHGAGVPVMFTVSKNKDPRYAPYVSSFRPVAELVIGNVQPTVGMDTTGQELMNLKKIVADLQERVAEVEQKEEACEAEDWLYETGT